MTYGPWMAELRFSGLVHLRGLFIQLITRVYLPKVGDEMLDHLPHHNNQPLKEYTPYEHSVRTFRRQPKSKWSLDDRCYPSLDLLCPISLPDPKELFGDLFPYHLKQLPKKATYLPDCPTPVSFSTCRFHYYALFL